MLWSFVTIYHEQMVSWQFGDNYDQAAGLKLTHSKQRGANK